MRAISQLITTVSPTKTDEPIEMPLGDRLAWAQGTMGVRLLDY